MLPDVQAVHEAQAAQEAQLAEAISSGEEDGTTAGAAAFTPAPDRQRQADAAEPMQLEEHAQQHAERSPEEQHAARQQQAAATSADAGVSAHTFIASHAPATTPRAPRRAQVAVARQPGCISRNKHVSSCDAHRFSNLAHRQQIRACLAGCNMPCSRGHRCALLADVHAMLSE